MGSEDNDRIDNLFRKASELEPGERKALLDEACGSDLELRDQVESLLECDLKSTATQSPTLDADLPRPGAMIDGYRILESVGEGGMGVVYLAEQDTPRRNVALKIIKWGMDTRQVVARFEAERQTLALMDHPNVAKVFDAGATERGRPYFVMELVKGESITRYCDRQGLPINERLELFIQVCEGIQHAHQKAIIHRDIKPSNVLVQKRDGKAVPKVIDFGVAKATAQRLTEKTLVTEYGQMIGTPDYMSPEQTGMSELDIDTRTDVYSLGVLLYQLLVGVLPFDPADLRRSDPDELRRTIREEQPSKPSARLTSLREMSTGVAKRRRTDVPTLKKLLRGDLDWITMKALEKDRTRRYGSANELSADIRHHLRHEPVSAGPPSKVYRARKFVRRHTVGVAMVGFLMAVLLGVSVVMSVQATKIAREAETAEFVLGFLEGVFERSDPSEARGEKITALELLEQGADRIERELVDQPEVQARLMMTMGNVHRELGIYDAAERLLERSLEIRREVLGESHPDTVHSLNGLGRLRYYQGRWPEAETLYLEALELQRRALGEIHPDTLRSKRGLAALYSEIGSNDKAEPIILETLADSQAVLGEDHPDTLRCMDNLAILYWRQGRLDEAEPLYLRTLEKRRRVLGGDHPDTLATMNGLAVLYKVQGRDDTAEQLYRETLEIQRRVLGESHRETLATMNNLANLCSKQGRHEEARQFLERVIAISEEGGKTEDAFWPVYLHTMGEMSLATGDHEEAEDYLRRAVDIYDERGGSENLGLALYQLAGLTATRGDRRAALEFLRRALDEGHLATGIAEDPDLVSLHGDPEFESLVAEVRARETIEP